MILWLERGALSLVGVRKRGSHLRGRELDYLFCHATIFQPVASTLIFFFTCVPGSILQPKYFRMLLVLRSKLTGLFSGAPP